MNVGIDLGTTYSLIGRLESDGTPTLLPDHTDPGHPEDERHCFIIPSLGLQLLAGPDRIIRTIFFMLESDENVSAFPWTTANGVSPSSSQRAGRSRASHRRAA